MTEPTDAEIDALWRELFQQHQHSRRSFARAVLAKWGKPPAVAGEPVATIKSWTNGSYWRNYKVEWHRNDLPEGAQLYTTPQPTQAQDGAVPLTDERLVACIKAAGFKAWDSRMWALKREIEAAHGIKGGQHGGM